MVALLAMQGRSSGVSSLLTIPAGFLLCIWLSIYDERARDDGTQRERDEPLLASARRRLASQRPPSSSNMPLKVQQSFQLSMILNLTSVTAAFLRPGV